MASCGIWWLFGTPKCPSNRWATDLGCQAIRQSLKLQTIYSLAKRSTASFGSGAPLCHIASGSTHQGRDYMSWIYHQSQRQQYCSYLSSKYELRVFNNRDYDQPPSISLDMVYEETMTTNTFCWLSQYATSTSVIAALYIPKMAVQNKNVLEGDFRMRLAKCADAAEATLLLY